MESFNNIAEAAGGLQLPVFCFLAEYLTKNAVIHNGLLVAVDNSPTSCSKIIKKLTIGGEGAGGGD